MKTFRWAIHSGGRCVDVGTITAESEREAMAQVMRDQAKGKEADKCYQVTVGDITMSTFGDEFVRSAQASGWHAEQDLTAGGHLFGDRREIIWSELKERMQNAIPVESLEKLRGAANKAREAFTRIHLSGFPYIPENRFPLCDPDREREFQHLTNISCSHQDMSGDAINPGTGEIHAQCIHCGYISPQGTGRFYDPTKQPGKPRSWVWGQV